MDFYAHSPNKQRQEYELLSAHICDVAQKSSEFSKSYNSEALGWIVGFLHDLGKYQNSFQDKLTKNNSIKVEHSVCGAKEAFEIFNEKLECLTAQVLSYVIAGHHSGLPNFGTSIDNEQMSTLSARLKRKTENFSAYKTDCKYDDLAAHKSKLLSWVKDFVYKCNNDKPFAISLYTRMLFSSLVDADSLETERFYNYGQARAINEPNFHELKQKLDSKYESIPNKVYAINQKRTEIRNFCIADDFKKKGLYSLTVPTGGGKTLASMSFALNNLLKNGYKRIIYVIPYTAIIEQTAKEFKKIFGEENILEHHSNFISEEMVDEETPLNLATENWDAPIILTTNVQFFESFFSNKRGDCRKLHNVANSVIVFDEAQMLPIPYFKPCLKLIDILTRNFNCTALLMSATCPDFVQHMHSDSQIVEINKNYRQHYLDFKRISAKFIGKKTDDELVQAIDYNSRTLFIVNSRKHAKALFSKITAQNKYHLSTLMMPKHRKEVLDKIKTDLSKKKPCVVVSTQLIECGVDLDFQTVYRSLAGIDSIVQAGGRCNREGGEANSIVYIFEAAENDPNKGDIPIYKSIARTLCENAMKENKDIFDLSFIQTYFTKLLNYKDKETDILNIQELFRITSDEYKRPLLDFKFAECAEKFKYIDSANRYDIVILKTDEAKKLYKKIEKPCFDTDLRVLYRQLGQYTVSIYEFEYKKLKGKNILKPFAADKRQPDERQSILIDDSFYSDDFGLDISAEMNPDNYIL